MVKWIIREPNNIKRVISRLGKPEKKKYFELIMAFRNSTDPIDLADEQMIVGGTIVYVARLNRKYRTKFAVIPNQKIIIILSVGDHKEVGLKES